MKIYIVRHGEALDDIDNEYGGAADHPLTDKGREQAKELSIRLMDSNLQAILSSPLVRAYEAAKIIASNLPSDLQVIVVDSLKERNSYGVMSGVNKDKAAELFKYLLDGDRTRSGYSRKPMLGAEDLDEFVGRVDNTFTELVQYAQANSLERIAIVTHGTFVRVLLEQVLKLGNDLKPQLGEIHLLDYQPAIAKLEVLK